MSLCKDVKVVVCGARVLSHVHTLGYSMTLGGSVVPNANAVRTAISALSQSSTVHSYSNGRWVLQSLQFIKRVLENTTLFLQEQNTAVNRLMAAFLGWAIAGEEVAGALLPNPAANTAVKSFMKNMSNFNEKECSIKVVDKAVCNLSNLDISSCPNSTVSCCNDSAVSVLTCTSSFISSQASSAMTNVYETQNPAVKQGLFKRLGNFLVNGGTNSSQISSNVTKNFGQYIKNICKEDLVTEQSAAVPSLKLRGCSSDVINVYNRSDVNIRCAAGAISQFFPQLTPGPPTVSVFQVSKQTGTYLIVLAGVFGAFMVLLILLTVGSAGDKGTVI